MDDDKPLFTYEEQTLIWNHLVELADFLGVFDREELSDIEIEDKNVSSMIL